MSLGQQRLSARNWQRTRAGVGLVLLAHFALLVMLGLLIAVANFAASKQVRHGFKSLSVPLHCLSFAVPAAPGYFLSLSVPTGAAAPRLARTALVLQLLHALFCLAALVTVVLLLNGELSYVTEDYLSLLCCLAQCGIFLAYVLFLKEAALSWRPQVGPSRANGGAPLSLVYDLVWLAQDRCDSRR
jgi:hypothetical protein